MGLEGSEGTELRDPAAGPISGGAGHWPCLFWACLALLSVNSKPETAAPSHFPSPFRTAFTEFCSALSPPLSAFGTAPCQLNRWLFDDAGGQGKTTARQPSIPREGPSATSPLLSSWG